MVSYQGNFYARIAWPDSDSLSGQTRVGSYYKRPSPSLKSLFIYENGGKQKPLELTNHSPAKQNQRFIVDCAWLISLEFLHLLPLFDFRLISSALSAELTKSILNDLSNGRSPSIAIDKFRSYCRNPDGSWLAHIWRFLIPFSLFFLLNFSCGKFFVWFERIAFLYLESDFIVDR